MYCLSEINLLRHTPTVLSLWSRVGLEYTTGLKYYTTGLAGSVGTFFVDFLASGVAWLLYNARKR